MAVAAYFGFYYGATVESRKLQKAGSPELAWLKEEFHLNDADFTRVCQMHESYLAGCAERCRRIDEKNEQLRAECQTRMLEEFYAVSRSMPPDQAKRYLVWVQGQTLLSDTHRQMQGSALSPMGMDMGASHH